jgi:uncharacterized protein (DUF433 family)
MSTATCRLENTLLPRDVCGGRPTLKYTRMDARWVMMYLQQGRTKQELAEFHDVPVAAIDEVIDLANVYNYEKSYVKSEAIKRKIGKLRAGNIKGRLS